MTCGRCAWWLGFGATDPDDRARALDRMGVARQLVFPPVTLPALTNHGPDAQRVLRRYNDAVLDWASAGPGRLFPVLQLPGGDVEAMVHEALRVVARGGRAVEIGFATPPGGCSPADPVLDRLWARSLTEGSPSSCTSAVVDPAARSHPIDRSSIRAGAPRRRCATPSSDRCSRRLVRPRHDPHPGQGVPERVGLGGVLAWHPDLAIGVAELGVAWVQVCGSLGSTRPPRASGGSGSRCPKSCRRRRSAARSASARSTASRSRTTSRCPGWPTSSVLHGLPPR